MAWIRNITIATSFSILLSGCNMYKLQDLRSTTLSGTPFQNELSHLYMDYAAQQEKGYDWFNSWHFADKGLMLAYGRDVAPEEVEDWNISPEVRPEMQRERNALMAVLTPDVMRAAPVRAAEAQFYFDCWVKESEQGWRYDQIGSCHENLDRALSDLHAPGVKHYSELEAIPAPHKKHKKKMPAPKPVAAIAEPEVVAEKPSPKSVEKAPVKVVEKPVEKPLEKVKDTKPAKIEKEKPAAKAATGKEAAAESTSYAVFFEPGKAEVSEPGMNVITEIIKSLRDSSDYAVVLHNSKDHPGKAAERVQVVKKLLMAGGVKESAMKVASGNADVETGKPVSRRVEIFLNE